MIFSFVYYPAWVDSLIGVLLLFLLLAAGFGLLYVGIQWINRRRS